MAMGRVKKARCYRLIQGVRVTGLFAGQSKTKDCGIFTGEK